MISSIKSNYLALCQKVGAALHAPSQAQVQIGLFVLGVALLAGGLASGALAQNGQTGLNNLKETGTINFNDERISAAVATIFGYIEGTFGALVMVVSGLGAILSSAFGQYRAALGCLVVAVGAFILRSFVSTFFNLEDVNNYSGGM